MAIAIAAGGEEALVRALDLLTDEIMTAMGLMGTPQLDMINADCISPAPATADPRVFSAFPLLDEYSLEGLT
jgi:isopentenyl diphosphate isomerase/L-lactate dehydrogenase-like FMN-dependent dehydrogenase